MDSNKASQNRLFNDYFGDFWNIENVFLLMGQGNSDGGKDQLMFDIKSYCLVHRLFMEQLSGEEGGLLAGLRLFRFPAIAPMFRERAGKMLADEWSQIWIDHLRKARHLFESDTEHKMIFIKYLLENASDWNDWISALTDVFVKETASEGLNKYYAFIRECCNNVTNADELMREYRDEGFTPDLKCYQSYETLLKKIGI